MNPHAHGREQLVSAQSHQLPETALLQRLAREHTQLGESHRKALASLKAAGYEPFSGDRKPMSRYAHDQQQDLNTSADACASGRSPAILSCATIHTENP